ncbi:copper resistance protein NlpE N-terminal domain-containing protein, partial [Elizabethkingia meningoseptica]
MKKNVLVIAAATGMLLASCSKKEKPAETTISEVTKTEVKTDSTSTESGIDDSHNAQNSLDWAGTYEGTVPCADCPGIKTTITL